MLSENKYAKARYRTCCQLPRQRCRELKNKWWLTKAAELQTLADSNDPKGFNQRMRAVWEAKNEPPRTTALDNKTILTEKRKFLTR